MTRRRIASWWQVALVAVVLLSSCAVPVDVGPKTGGNPLPLVLRLGTANEPGTVAGTMVADFASTMAEISHGTIVIDVVQLGRGQASREREVVTALREGDVDLALVATRAWADSGVESLRLLQVPAFATSDYMAVLVNEFDIRDALLADLPSTGVTPLLLVPEGLRHLAIYGGTDWPRSATLDGIRVGAAESRDGWQTIRLLGGEPVALVDVAEQLAREDFQAVETTLAEASTLPGSPRLVPNISTYFGIQLLAANSARLNRLSPEVREKVTKAVDEFWVLADLTRPQEATLWDLVCARGSTALSMATAGEKRRIEVPLVRFRQEVAKEPKVRRLIDLYVPMTGHTAGDDGIPYQCDLGRPAIEPRPGELPDGSYRIEVTEQMLRLEGVADPGRLSGVWTFALASGSYTWTRTGGGAGLRTGGGIYEVTGDRVAWWWDHSMGGYAVDFSWSVDRDGALWLRPTGRLPAADVSIVRLGPLRRIG